MVFLFEACSARLCVGVEQFEASTVSDFFTGSIRVPVFACGLFPPRRKMLNRPALGFR